MKAERRVKALKKALKSIGLGDERLEMYFMSAGMPDKFVEYTIKFVEKIKHLGLSPIKVSEK
jgi:coenzyme F420-reducing hydrogenase delta subunit